MNKTHQPIVVASTFASVVAFFAKRATPLFLRIFDNYLELAAEDRPDSLRIYVDSFDDGQDKGVHMASTIDVILPKRSKKRIEEAIAKISGSSLACYVTAFEFEPRITIHTTVVTRTRIRESHIAIAMQFHLDMICNFVPPLLDLAFHNRSDSLVQELLRISTAATKH